jgi:DNA-directed RNA polymerase specialized sigma subunit
MKKENNVKGNHYFTQIHENAILEYCSQTVTRERKSELYVLLIKPAFDEMVDKIILTYKFTNLPNIDDLREDCKVWLITILDKYDTSKGSKAFSYFSVITKNWFIHKTKKNNRSLQKEVATQDILNEYEHENLVLTNPYESDREDKEFWTLLYQEMHRWNEMPLKDNERRVLIAIQDLFNNIEQIQIFNKKAIYLYLREITGLNTKQIVSSLSVIRKVYFDFREKWDSGEP